MRPSRHGLIQEKRDPWDKEVPASLSQEPGLPSSPSGVEQEHFTVQNGIINNIWDF
jgi:hypothetical protein